MTVKELIQQLKACNPNATVYIASDEEGNGFGNVHEVAYNDDTKTKVTIWPADTLYDV